jgi:cell division protein FtsW (lipid II flippase)
MAVADEAEDPVKRRHLGSYAIVLAILIAGLALAGVPLTTVLFGLLVLGCPLMMVFMHGGHGGSKDQSHDQHRSRRRDG